MDLRINKFKKKIFSISLVLILLAFLVISPFSRNQVTSFLKHPLQIFTLIRRELGAIIYYHRNFTQNEKLKRDLSLLRYKLNAQEEVYLENERLKGLLSFKERSDFRLIACRVIARSADNWSSIIIIDKGRKDGIAEGSTAVTHLGFVGRVIETADTTSKVVLINDPNMAVACLVQRSRQMGLISGALGDNLIMRYLGKNPDIKLRDTIVTSGLNQTNPKGILIGTVIEVREDFSGTSFYAIVKPSVDLFQIEELFIIAS